jgi:uncharacterized protein (DUF486 family)
VRMRTVLLLIASNLFMNTAWYWHLLVKNGRLPLAGFILISWLLALPEYCLAVPANRIGHIAQGGSFTAPQLKIIQEALTLGTFLVLNLLFLRQEAPRWREMLGMLMIVGGLAVALSGRLRS